MYMLFAGHTYVGPIIVKENFLFNNNTYVFSTHYEWIKQNLVIFYYQTTIYIIVE